MSQLAISVEFVELYMDSGSSETTTYSVLTKGQDITNCVPFASWYCGNEQFDGSFPDIWFTDTGNPTIHAERTDYNTEDMFIKIYVVEFDPTKVKVYQGAIPTTVNYNSETSVTITTSSGTFDQDRTAMVFYYRTENVPNLNYLGQHMIRGQVGSDGTSISFVKMLSVANNHYGHYFAFESVDNDFIVNHKTGSTATITSYEVGVYDWHNTFLICSYCTGFASNYLAYTTMAAYLDGNASVSIHKYNSSHTAYYNIQKIEFYNSATASGVRYCPKVLYSEIGSSATSVELDFKANVQSTDTLSVVNVQNPTSLNSTLASYLGEAFVATWLTSSGTKYRTERCSGHSVSKPTYHFVDWNGQLPLYQDLGINTAPIASGISPVKSVENLSITVPAYTPVEVIRLSKGQDVNNCVVFKSGYGLKTASYDDQDVHENMVYFIGNELYLERGGVAWGSSIELSVVEFYADQVRVQQGRFHIEQNATATTVTLGEEVDPSKTFLVFGHLFESVVDGWAYHQCRGFIENGNTLGFDRGLSHTYPIMGSWYVVEDLGDNWDVVHENTAYTTILNYSYISSTIFTPKHNCFALFSTKCSSTSNAAGYCTWQNSYSTPLVPSYFYRNSNSNNSQLSIQSVVFSNSSRIRTQQLQQTLTGYQTTLLADLDTTSSGKAITPLLGNLNGQYAVYGITATFTVMAFTKVSYNPTTHQITTSRAPDTGQSVTTGGLVTAVCWEGAVPDFGDIEIADLGYFVKSMERYSYIGTNQCITNGFYNGQNLNNCIPIATYSVGEGSCDELDKVVYGIWQYPELGILNIESNWPTDNPGIDLDLTLLEFDPTQVKVQQGFATLLEGVAVVTATIEAVDTTKTFMIHNVRLDDSMLATFGPGSVAGKIATSTQLNFERGLTTSRVLIYWYVVECLQDQWEVFHHEINNQSLTSYEYILPTPVPLSSSVSWMSYSQEQSTFIPAQCMFYTYPEVNSAKKITKIRADKYATSAEVERINFSVISFNEGLGVYTNSISFSFSGVSNSVTVALDKDYDINRTIIWPGQSWPFCKTNTTTPTYTRRGFFKAVLQDERTLLVTRESGSTTSVDAWGHVYLLEISIPSHEVSGIVTEEGIFINRQLRLHRTDTGSVLGDAESSAVDGAYTFYTTYSGSTYAVCLDDEAGVSYNGLVVTDIYPGLIENSWPGIAGW